MKFLTALEHFGKTAELGVDKLMQYATVAQPFVAIANPGAGALMATSIGVVGLVEKQFAAINKQSGTGPQKLAMAVSVLEPYILSVFNTKDATVAQTYVNAVVAMLNVPVAAKA